MSFLKYFAKTFFIGMIFVNSVFAPDNQSRIDIIIAKMESESDNFVAGFKTRFPEWGITNNLLEKVTKMLPTALRGVGNFEICNRHDFAERLTELTLDAIKNVPFVGDILQEEFLQDAIGFLLDNTDIGQAIADRITENFLETILNDPDQAMQLLEGGRGPVGPSMQRAILDRLVNETDTTRIQSLTDALTRARESFDDRVKKGDKGARGEQILDLIEQYVDDKNALIKAFDEQVENDIFSRRIIERQWKGQDNVLKKSNLFDLNESRFNIAVSSYLDSLKNGSTLDDKEKKDFVSIVGRGFINNLTFKAFRSELKSCKSLEKSLHDDLLKSYQNYWLHQQTPDMKNKCKSLEQGEMPNLRSEIKEMKELGIDKEKALKTVSGLSSEEDVKKYLQDSVDYEYKSFGQKIVSSKITKLGLLLALVYGGYCASLKLVPKIKKRLEDERNKLPKHMRQTPIQSYFKRLWEKISD